jgi:hypothetical protein
MTQIAGLCICSSAFIRTTLNISDDLYAAVKVEAARRGETVTIVIEDAMCQLVAKSEMQPEVSFPGPERSGGLRA